MGAWWQMAALAAATAAAPVEAQASCVWTDLVRDEVGTAVVQSSAARVHFVKDDALQRDCPNAGAACKGAAYLTPGDVVLACPAQGRYTCAGFVGANGTTTIGWLPSEALVAQGNADQRPADWNGHWTAPEQGLAIVPADAGALAVKGDATWGMGDPERRRRGGVHTGKVAGTARPVGRILAFTMGEDGKTLPYDAGDEFTCRVRMFRRGPYLLVRDNNACGGANVSFSGFYRRKG